MKSILFVILSMFMSPISAGASDQYDLNSKAQWKSKAKIRNNVVLKSKYIVSMSDVAKFKYTYRITRKRFSDFTGLNLNKCNIKPLEIRVISLNDLSNKKYFPDEHKYSFPADKNGKGDFVLGRYFRYNNHLYLAPKYNHMYWNINFAHELAHHFYDECVIHFADNESEHDIIHKFEDYFERMR